MNSLGLLLRIREASLAARSDFGGTSSSLATLLLRLFVSSPLSPVDTLWKGRAVSLRASGEGGILNLVRMYSMVLNIPLYYSPLSKILPLRRFSRIRWVENKTARNVRENTEHC
jgi:hypothetical protein